MGPISDSTLSQVIQQSAEESRLTILSYRDVTLHDKHKEPFEAFYNPNEFSAAYTTLYSDETATTIGDNGKDLKFLSSSPTTFNFNLKIDGTGAANPSRHKWKHKVNVDDEIEKFIQTAYVIEGDIHRPAYLVLSWGRALLAAVVLTSFTVRKTLFSSNGSTLRAELTCGFKEFENPEKARAARRFKSPDVTHTRTVQQGDKLPLMCERIYGDAKLYLEVARYNGLSNYRNLQPGTTIYFPPLLTTKS